MPISHRIAFIAVGALAVMASTATTASAQETPVQVIQEDGSPCNPCSVHIRGESHIRALPSGVIISRCVNEFNARIYSNGTGEIETDFEEHIAPGCPIVNCTTYPNYHWPLTMGEIGNGVEHLTVRMCLKSGVPELFCTWEGLIQEHLPADSHDYEFRTPTGGAICGLRVFEGMWETEHDPASGDQEIRIVHHS